jgi:hypothetical protein
MNSRLSPCHSIRSISRDYSRAVRCQAGSIKLHRKKESKMPTIMRQQTDGPTLATYGHDPFEAYANAVAPRTIIGTLLRFSKGDYIAGEEGKQIPQGSTFTANVDELLAGWVKWSGGKPVEHIMVRVAEGRMLPKRESLGDAEASRWEVDGSGVPRDPWQFTNYLPLLDEQREVFTFATSSRGGLTAVGDLTRRYGRHPLFRPAGWAPKAGFNEALAAAGFTPGTEPPASQEETQADEMNDDIPF